MATPYEQDLAKLRGILHVAQSAKSNYEILQQHRPLVDAIRYALGLLDRMHPGEEALRNTVLMMRMAFRRVPLADGRVQYLLTDARAVQTTLARIDQLLGPFDDA